MLKASADAAAFNPMALWRTLRADQFSERSTKAPVHRYRFALQDTDIRAEDDLSSIGGGSYGAHPACTGMPSFIAYGCNRMAACSTSNFWREQAGILRNN